MMMGARVSSETSIDQGVTSQNIVIFTVLSSYIPTFCWNWDSTSNYTMTVSFQILYTSQFTNHSANQCNIVSAGPNWVRKPSISKDVSNLCALLFIKCCDRTDPRHVKNENMSPCLYSPKWKANRSCKSLERDLLEVNRTPKSV